MNENERQLAHSLEQLKVDRKLKEEYHEALKAANSENHRLQDANEMYDAKLCDLESEVHASRQTAVEVLDELSMVRRTNSLSHVM